MMYYIYHLANFNSTYLLFCRNSGEGFKECKIPFHMKTILTHVLLLAAFACYAQSLHSSTNRQIVFEDVSVIPMDEEKVLEHQVVGTRNGRITAVGPRAGIKYDRDAIVIDATGKYLIPGLAEMHAHVPPNDDVESMKEVLKLFALNGITTIRGMLGHPRHLELRER